MTGDIEPVGWRLTGITAADDDSRVIAAVSTPDGRTREYLFSRDAITIGGRPAFGWDATDWDEHTLYDRGSFKAVMTAVKSFHRARGQETGPAGAWRLCGIGVAEDDSGYVAVLSDADGRTRECTFVWDGERWGGDEPCGRASLQAVLDAVIAFHEARQREMALGDDENREPPEL